jgi:hypothetical protein
MIFSPRQAARIMPEISRFLGIVITMYYDDHAPPHFHARYGDAKARFDIESIEILSGRLSPRAHRLVQDWGTINRDALMYNWRRAQRQEPLERSPPLE